MAIEDKELFVKTVKDIMIPVACGLGYIFLTLLLTTMWFPFFFIMVMIAFGGIITFSTYKERLRIKKHDEELEKLYSTTRHR